MDTELTVAIKADTRDFESAIDNLQNQASKFGDQLTGAFSDAVVSGKSLDDILRKIASGVTSSALSAGLKPLQSLLNNAAGNLFSSLGSALPFAQGGIISSGGVVTSPSYFPMAGQIGVAGEAGAEAIMPLSRGADGSLGVVAGGAAAAPVTVHIHTNDAQSFRKSEQQVAGAVARAVARGQRVS
ncbi:MAG: phage tail tape measure protein [Ahrensia sp.]